jgi:hypothetical protein
VGGGSQHGEEKYSKRSHAFVCQQIEAAISAGHSTLLFLASYWSLFFLAGHLTLIVVAGALKWLFLLFGSASS